MTLLTPLRVRKFRRVSFPRHPPFFLFFFFHTLFFGFFLYLFSSLITEVE